MKTSLTRNAEELKNAIISLEKDILSQALEYAREIFGKMLEQVYTLIQKHRPAGLVIIHKRNTWYRTWLGMVRPIFYSKMQFWWIIKYKNVIFRE